MTLLVIIGVVAAGIGLLYAMALAWMLFQWNKSDQLQDDSSFRGLVSVLIPVRNEEDNIGQCLECLATQELGQGGMEVILVDDHSTDATISRAMTYSERLRLRLIQLDDRESGKKAALRRAAKEASGELLVSLDADGRFGSQFIATVSRYFNDDGCRMLLGPVRMTRGKGVLGWFPAIDFLALQATGAATALGGRPVMANGANLAIRKVDHHEVSSRVPGQELASGDDMFLLMAMKRRFGADSIRYARDPRAIVDTPGPAGFREFISQRMRWVSKSRAFTDASVIRLALLIYLFNLIILAAFALSAIEPRLILLGIGLLSLKFLADFSLLRSFAGFSGQDHLMWFYVQAQLIYPVYSVLLLPVSWLFPGTWKGRKLSGS